MPIGNKHLCQCVCVARVSIYLSVVALLHKVTEGKTEIGSCVLELNSLVFHIYEKIILSLFLAYTVISFAFISPCINY